MPEYKIRYKDRRVQPVTADTFRISDSVYAFHRDGSIILTVAKDDIESVGLAELADPVSRVPRSAAV